MDRSLNGGLRNWWRDQHIYKAESVTLKVQREEVVSHVWWAWNQENVQLLKRWRDHLLRLTFRPRLRKGEDWVTYRRSCARAMRARWKGMGLLNMNCHWRRYNGNVPSLPGACHGTDKVVQTQAKDPTNASRWVPQQRVAWDTPFAKWSASEDWVLKLDKEPFTKKDLVKKFLMQVGEPVEPVSETEGGGPPSREPRKLHPMGWPHGDGWAQGKRTLEVRGTNKRVVTNGGDW